MTSVPKRDQATKIRKCGGKAFPHDYNWTCPQCGRESRAFEFECGYCRWDQEFPDGGASLVFDCVSNESGTLPGLCPKGV